MATIPANRQIIGKLFISRPDGMTYEDISDYLCSAEIELGDVSSVGTGATGADGVVRQMTFALHNDKDVRFSPRDKVSPINQFNAQYSPLLWPMRKVYLRTAIIGNQESGTTCRFNREIGVGDGFTKEFSLGIAPILQDSEKIYVNDIWTTAYQINYDAGTVIFIVAPASGAIIKADYTYYHTVFTGYLGDDIQPEGSVVTCQCRDLAKLLQRDYIEYVGQYGTDEGVPAEETMQSILDGHIGSGVVTLYVAKSPGFLIKPYILEYKSVWDALQEIVAQFGWFVGYRWNETTNEFQLTLLEPPRDKDSTTADFTLNYEDDFYKNSLSFSDADIRNALKLTYFDIEQGKAVTLLPDGDGLKDQASIDEYGRLAMEIAEKDTSLIDTKDEALTFGMALINDLKDIGATDKINMPFLPQMDVFCGINVIDPRYSSTTDFFGVESVRHTLDFKNGKFRTEIVGSGRVVGARQKWLRMQTRPGAGEPIHFRNILERNANIIIAASDTPYAKKKLADYVCDGKADQIQINEAIESLDNGGKILLLEGTYVIDSAILINNNIMLEGQGYNTIMFLDENTIGFQQMIKNTDNVNGNTNIMIEKLVLDGNKDNLLHLEYFKQCIVLENVKNSIISKVKILNVWHGVEGVSVSDCENIDIINCIITDNGGHGIGVLECKNINVSQNTCRNNSRGINIINSQECSASNNSCSDNSNEGIYMLDSSSLTIDNNICTKNSFQGIFIKNTNNSNIKGNTCMANGQYRDNVIANIKIIGTSKNNNIQNNICRIGTETNRPNYGIWILDPECEKNLVTNNDLLDSGAAGSLRDDGTGTITTAGNRS